MTAHKEKLEQVSALIDGESDNAQAAIDWLLKDEQARKAWADQHAVRDVMHGGAEVKASSQFSSAVMAAIDSEPTVLVPQARKSESPVSEKAKVVPFLRPVAGLAIAATVAAVTVLSFDGINGAATDAGAPSVAVAPTQVQASSVVPVAFTGTYDATDRTYWQGSDEQMQDELNGYLADHAEHANTGGYQSMVPYVRLVGYDSNR